MSFRTLTDDELCGQLQLLESAYELLDETSTQACPTPVRQFYDNYLRSSDSCTHLEELIEVYRAAASTRGLDCA